MASISSTSTMGAETSWTELNSLFCRIEDEVKYCSNIAEIAKAAVIAAKNFNEHYDESPKNINGIYFVSRIFSILDHPRYQLNHSSKYHMSIFGRVFLEIAIKEANENNKTDDKRKYTKTDFNEFVGHIKNAKKHIHKSYQETIPELESSLKLCEELKKLIELV